MAGKYVPLVLAVALVVIGTPWAPVRASTVADGGLESLAELSKLRNSADHQSVLPARTEARQLWSYTSSRTACRPKFSMEPAVDCSKMDTDTSMYKCCNGVCTDVYSDSQKCKYCANSCPVDEVCVMGSCKNLLKDPFNCGEKGKTCPLISGSRTCLGGVCVGPDGYY